MGILDHYFPPPDPAASWPPGTAVPLSCTLDDSSFSGLKLGDPAEEISRFGPPENDRPTRDGRYDYPSRGFEVDATDGKVDCFVFRWDAMDPARHFKGAFLQGGRPLKLGPSTGEDEVKGFFGMPYWIDDELGEKICFYEFRGGSLEWQVEFVRGRLSVLTIVTPPLLAGREQRDAYGVTRPWPPLL